MSAVFKNIDPPPPHRPAIVYPPAFGAGGGHTRWVERGWGVNILEDDRNRIAHIHAERARQKNCASTAH
jgi:hypothetical protein